MLVKSTILHGRLSEVIKGAEDTSSDRGSEISPLEKKEIQASKPLKIGGVVVKMAGTGM